MAKNCTLAVYKIFDLRQAFRFMQSGQVDGLPLLLMLTERKLRCPPICPFANQRPLLIEAHLAPSDLMPRTQLASILRHQTGGEMGEVEVRRLEEEEEEEAEANSKGKEERVG